MNCSEPGWALVCHIVVPYPPLLHESRELLHANKLGGRGRGDKRKRYLSIKKDSLQIKESPVPVFSHKSQQQALPGRKARCPLSLLKETETPAPFQWQLSSPSPPSTAELATAKSLPAKMIVITNSAR